MSQEFTKEQVHDTVVSMLSSSCPKTRERGEMVQQILEMLEVAYAALEATNSLWDKSRQELINVQTALHTKNQMSNRLYLDLQTALKQLIEANDAKNELLRIRHALWHALDDAREQYDGVLIDKDDAKKLGELISEKHPPYRCDDKR